MANSQPVIILAGSRLAARRWATDRGITRWTFARSRSDVSWMRHPEVYVLPSFDQHPLHATLAEWLSGLLAAPDGPQGRASVGYPDS